MTASDLNKEKNGDAMKKILIYGDVDLNLIDGSSVWLVNLARLLSMDEEIMVDILLKKRIRNERLVRELRGIYRVRLLYVKNYIDRLTEVDAGNIVKVISRIDALRDYACFIIRGMGVMKPLLHSPLIDRVVPYLTDFCHDSEQISDAEKDFLRTLYERVKVYLVQTDAMKRYLQQVLGVDGAKYRVLYPIVFPFPQAERERGSLIYAGKIARDWNIIELLDIMEELKNSDPDITLHMVGDKVNRDMAEEKEEIFRRLNEGENIQFYGSLSRGDLREVMSRCELGYAFRSTRVDHDGSLEVSVKLLEYLQAGIPMVLRRSAMHEEILGSDYPLFAESEQECLEKIRWAFAGNRIERLREQLNERAARFSVPKTIEMMREALSVFPEQRQRLLVSGHDLKFLKPLFARMKEEYDLIVQEQSEYTDFSVREAKRLRDRADIIWCEWLLTSARWYSRNAYPHQRLFVRAHRFEVNRRYGRNLNVIALDQLITVSYYYMEEFMRRFSIPLEKCCVINNFIDMKNYERPKREDAQFHIALIGALPKRKGLARAVELIKLLRRHDSRYVLHVPGKRPEEFANTWNVPEERAYYERIYQQIKEEHLEDAVIFDGWVDVPAFLSKIGYVLSMSDAKQPESFHVTPFEGLASRAMALALPWEGIEYLYPKACVVETVERMAARILFYQDHPRQLQEDIEACRAYAAENYDIEVIWQSISRLLRHGGNDEEVAH